MKTLCLIYLLLLSYLPHIVSQQIDLEADFKKLDDAILKKDSYINKKQQEIDVIKKDFATTAPYDKYVYFKRLFDKYMKFNPDSAEVYVQRCKAVALTAGMNTEYLQSEIDEAMITVLRSDCYRAKILLDKIGAIDDLPPFLRVKLAIVYMEFYIRRVDLTLGSDVNILKIKEEDFWNNFKHYFPEGSWTSDYYETLITHKDLKDRLLAHLQKTAQPSIQAAMIECALAKIYEKEGNKEQRCHHLIMSAINDIQMGNREAQSLVELINSNYVDLGSKRAFQYVMICTENANYYKDMGRSLNILNAHTKITKVFNDRLEQKVFYLSLISGLLGLSIVIILLLMHIISKKNRRRDQMLVKVDEINAMLQKKIEQGNEMQKKLELSNEKLQQEIEHRNRNFLNVYHLTSQYIHEMQVSKKRVSNLITTGKIDKALKELNLTSGETDKYMNNFYMDFDKAFLSSHHDFLERFNTLLKSEHQYSLTQDGNLPPELRIYALVSIGITDSVSIAKFLHYSPQTIYNYRFKMRNKANISETKLADAVCLFYTTKPKDTLNDL